MVERLAETVEEAPGRGGAADTRPGKRKGPRLAARPRYQAAYRAVSSCGSGVVRVESCWSELLDQEVVPGCVQMM
jgi:hypothetical protein